MTLIGLITQAVDLLGALADGRVRVDGDPRQLQRVMAVLAPVDPGFAVVTPEAFDYRFNSDGSLKAAMAAWFVAPFLL